jgi:RNase P subunit RPR2
MVRARLHVICGNCGCNDEFEYKHKEYPANAEETTIQYETVLTCKNCSTMHWLNDNSANKNKIREKGQ